MAHTAGSGCLNKMQSFPRIFELRLRRSRLRHLPRCVVQLFKIFVDFK